MTVCTCNYKAPCELGDKGPAGKKGPKKVTDDGRKETDDQHPIKHPIRRIESLIIRIR